MLWKSRGDSSTENKQSISAPMMGWRTLFLPLSISHFRFAPFCQSVKRLESSGVLRLDESGHQTDTFLTDYGQILEPSSEAYGSGFLYLYFKSSLTAPPPARTTHKDLISIMRAAVKTNRAQCISANETFTIMPKKTFDFVLK